MRPQILFSLFVPVSSLAGVGPRIAALIEKVAGGRILDLIWHLPTGIIDRRFAPTIREAPEGAIATMTVDVDSHQPPPAHRSRLPYRVRCSDGTGEMTLVFFHARPDYLQRVLPVGTKQVVSGRVEMFDGQVQMTHPDHIAPPEEIASLKRVEPVYGLTAGLTLKTLGKAVRGAVGQAPMLDEWQDPAWLGQQGWPGWKQAVEAAHAPSGPEALEPLRPERARLAYDELLASQLALLLVRARQRQMPGRKTAGDGRLRERVVAALPYRLTSSQEQAGAEIAADMGSQARMLRILQGDVGSGKTVVAFLAMLNAVEAGRQAALMAPTEILARQHHATMAPLAEAAGVGLALITGRDRTKARRAQLEGLESGETALAVGTHALFQEEVAFADLALAVIDEQHRFGVIQRHALRRKGQVPDLLVMTATPIPRTLAMTAYGDLDVSILDEKPAGRTLIKTIGLRQKDHEAALKTVREAASRKEQSYIIFPLVEKTEKSDLASAKQGFETLRDGPLKELNVGLLHGRIPPDERDAVMSSFKSGTTDVLVATTVIEVGVDVPTATVMIIENAEKFGLSQLHQLRGRIGRSDRPSFCYLVVDDRSVSPEASQRINAMLETSDGFEIAERDLTIRGPGEMLGTKQAGDGQFRIADLRKDADILTIARQDTLRVVFG